MIFDRIMGNLAIRQLIQTNLIVNPNLKLMLKILKFVLKEDDLNGRFMITKDDKVCEIISEYDRTAYVRLIEKDKVVELIKDVTCKRLALLVDNDNNHYKVPYSLYLRILNGFLSNDDMLLYDDKAGSLSVIYIRPNLNIKFNISDNVIGYKTLSKKIELLLNDSSVNISNYIKLISIHEGCLSLY